MQIKLSCIRYQAKRESTANPTRAAPRSRRDMLPLPSCQALIRPTMWIRQGSLKVIRNVRSIRSQPVHLFLTCLSRMRAIAKVCPTLQPTICWSSNANYFLNQNHKRSPSPHPHFCPHSFLRLVSRQRRKHGFTGHLSLLQPSS